MWIKLGIWLTTTRTGRAVAAVGGLALAIAAALVKAFSAGKDAERAKQDSASLDNLRHRAEVEDRINGMSIDERHGRLDQWSKD